MNRLISASKELGRRSIQKGAMGGMKPLGTLNRKVLQTGNLGLQDRRRVRHAREET